MNASEYAQIHHLTPERVNRMCRQGKLNARKLGFGALAFWEIIEPGEAFAPIDLDLTSKGIGGGWSLRVTQNDHGFTIHSSHIGHGATATEFHADAEDARYAYAAYKWDPARPVSVEPLTDRALTD